MKRLTERDEFGNANIIALSDVMSELYAGLSYSETNAMTDALNRLAAYEDTGLEPEEIEHRLKNERHWATIWMAEADDRLLVLPCRFGSDIYTIVTTDRSRGARACPHPVRHIRYGTLTWNNLRNVLDGFGKTVFLTREEAEAAMQKERKAEDE